MCMFMFFGEGRFENGLLLCLWGSTGGVGLCVCVCYRLGVEL